MSARSAKSLGVRYVLEGSVRKAGARVKETMAQLIDADDRGGTCGPSGSTGS